MSSPVVTYVRGVHQKFDFYAAWPPNQSRALGDVGFLADGQFQRRTSLGALGIKFAERLGPPGGDLSHTSGSSVSVQLKAQGQALPNVTIPQAKAGALIEFTASGAFVIQATAPAVREIEDQVALARDIADLFRTKVKGKRVWDEGWCVITELLTADKLTVLVSNSKSSKVELSAEGAIPAGPVPLASVGGGLSVVAQKGDVTSVLATANLTPMFRVMRLRRSVLDRLLGDDSSPQLGRAARSRGRGGPERLLEPVPLADGVRSTAPKRRAAPPAKARKGTPRRAAKRKPASQGRRGPRR